MKGALDVHRDLLGRDVPHEIVRLDRVVADARQLPDVLRVDPARCVVVHLFATGGGFTALATSAATPAAAIDDSLIAALTGVSRVRPASPLQINQLTDCAAGLVCPLLLPPAVALLADARLGAWPVLYSPTGEAGTAVGLATRDLLAVSGALVVSLAELPRPASLVELPIAAAAGSARSCPGRPPIGNRTVARLAAR